MALTAKAISPRVDSDWGDVTWDAVITNQDGDDRRHLRRAHLGGQDLAGIVTTVVATQVDRMLPDDDMLPAARNLVD